jgi:hypothetical protein
VIATSPAYHDHPPQWLLQNFPDTTREPDGWREFILRLVGGLSGVQVAVRGVGSAYGCVAFKLCWSNARIVSSVRPGAS